MTVALAPSFALSVVVTFAGAGCFAGTSPAADHHGDRAALAIAAGNFDEGEARARLALEYDPGSAKAHANLALVALARGDDARAERELRVALDLDRHLGEAWSSLGTIRHRRGDLRGARAAYRRALAIDPGIVDARHNLAKAMFDAGELEAARAELLRVRALMADASEPLGEVDLALVQVELRTGRRQMAARRLDALVERDAEPRAIRARADLRLARGDLAGAEADYLAVVAVPSPARVYAIAQVVNLRLRRADVDGARAFLETAGIHPDVPAPSPLLALVVAQLALAEGRAVDAVDEARRVLAGRAWRLYPAARAIVVAANASMGVTPAVEASASGATRPLR